MHYKKYTGEGYPPIQSFHVHVLFFQTNQNNTNISLAFYKEALAYFKIDKHCPHLFHNDYMCYFYPDMEAAGPFPTAQWAIYFLPEQYSQVVPYFMQHRDIGYTILVHPNTGAEKNDHSEWALWGGQPWPLDLTIFND